MIMRNRPPSDRSKSAFSLIELLVVIAIIGIIGAFAVPAASQLLKGSSISQAANLLTDQTAAARQQALTRNRSIEVRFYRFGDPEQSGESATDPNTGYFRALQYFEIADGGIPNPVGRFVRFPNSIVMSSEPTLSSVLNDTVNHPVTQATKNDPDLPRGVGNKYSYIAFRFTPDGATNLSPTGGPSNGLWFLTCHLLNDVGRAKNGIGDNPNQVHNFFTWMIDPVSGATKVLRPGVK